MPYYHKRTLEVQCCVDPVLGPTALQQAHPCTPAVSCLPSTLPTWIRRSCCRSSAWGACTRRYSPTFSIRNLKRSMLVSVHQPCEVAEQKGGS